MHLRVVADVVAGIEAAGGTVTADPATDILTVNREVTLTVNVVRCQVTAAGSLRWKLCVDASLLPDITVAVRLQPDNEEVRDHYLLPTLDVGGGARIRMGEDNGVDLDAYCTDKLEPLFRLLARRPLSRTA